MFICKVICWISVVCFGPSTVNFYLFLNRLDGVKFENGKINVIEKKTGNKSKLNQKKW